MNLLKIKILTLQQLVLTGFLLVFSCYIKADELKLESFKTHQRMNIYVQKDQLYVKQEGGKLSLQTLDFPTYQKLEAAFKETRLPPNYIKSLKTSKKNFPEKAATITLELASRDVDTFTFYRDNEKKYIIDFWLNEIVEDQTKFRKVEKRAKAALKKERKNKLKTQDKIIKPKTQEILPIVSRASGSKKEDARKGKTNSIEVIDTGYRDFRYGLAYIWDYEPLSPQIERFINLKRKIPDFLYPIADRNIGVDEKESHMQLSINMYRKAKWGLMNKSISLYEKKYGSDDSNRDLNDYLRANSILKKYINSSEKSPKKVAINILNNISLRTSNYELKRSILQYLLQHKLDERDYINSLKLAKRLYVTTRENFDHEIAEKAAEIILYSLAHLGQVDKIDSFIAEKSIKKLLPKAKLAEYKIFVLARRSKVKEVLNYFDKRSGMLQRPLSASIIFNVAEMYFRKSLYKQAIKYFDDFVENYSHLKESSQARLRIALSYDLSLKTFKKVAEMYANARNRSPDPKARYEAKLRYVGLKFNRKKQILKKDLETLVFLEQDPAEQKIIDKQMKRALWLVRLRSLINQKEYEKALSYLRAMPLKSFKPVERRMFLGDGAEIVYGVIKQAYNQTEYSQVVKVWETYKDQFETKVAMDPYANYLAADAYLKMGLMNSFKRTLDALIALKNEPVRTFPIWVKRGEEASSKTLIKELEVLREIHSKDYTAALAKVDELKNDFPKYKKVELHRGIIHFLLKDYQEARKSFENYLLVYEGIESLTHSELGKLFSNYLESLYRLGEIRTYMETADAMLKDMRDLSRKSPLIKSMTERVAYLYVEILAGEDKDESYLQVEPRIENFMNEYPNSVYTNRVKYLLGLSKIRNSKSEQGIEILNKLIESETTEGHIKELSKSELAALRLRNSTI